MAQEEGDKRKSSKTFRRRSGTFLGEPLDSFNPIVMGRFSRNGTRTLKELE